MKILIVAFLCLLSLKAFGQTITYNTSTNCVGSGTTSATCTLGASGVVGDLMLIVSKSAASSAGLGTAALTFSGTASCASPIQIGPSWDSGNSPAYIQTMMACIITASGANSPIVTWTATDGTFSDIAVATYHVTTSWNASMLDVSQISFNTTASTSCATGTTAATSHAIELVVAFCTNFNVGQTWGALGGFTQRANSSRNTTGWYDQFVSVTGAQSTTIPLSGSDQSTGQITTFFPNGATLPVNGKKVIF